MRSSLLASVDVIEFHTTEAYSILGLTKMRYIQILWRRNAVKYAMKNA
jgi:hypothetical protein